MSSLSIRPVSSRKETEAFIKFAWEIYRDMPAWVPPLLMDRRKLMDKEKNPFYAHAEAEFFLARREGAIVGRIGAVVNHNHNKEHHDKVGFFGFFECIDDQSVATALVQTAREWLSARGMSAIRGPASPSVNDEYGLLIEGFEHSPAVLMPYNPPYYARLLEGAGLAKMKDLYGYLMREENVFSEKFARVAELVRKREGLTIRSLNMKDFANEIRLIKRLYNEAWQYNWGAVPMRDERARVGAAIDRLQIDTRAQGEVRRLSGGNQQKVTIARWIAKGVETLLLFDPTRGIDIRTKRQIYALVRDLADQGAAVLYYTSELAEVRLACDRAVVIFGGRVVDVIEAADADEPTLMRAAYGLTEQTETPA